MSLLVKDVASLQSWNRLITRHLIIIPTQRGSNDLKL